MSAVPARQAGGGAQRQVDVEDGELVAYEEVAALAPPKPPEDCRVTADQAGARRGRDGVQVVPLQA